MHERQRENGIGVAGEQDGLRNAEFEPARGRKRIGMDDKEIFPAVAVDFQDEAFGEGSGHHFRIVVAELVRGRMQDEHDR